MRAFYTDIYGCHANLCRYVGRETTRLAIYSPSGDIIIRKEYKTWRGAMIALGKYGDCWRNDMTGRLV